MISGNFRFGTEFDPDPEQEYVVTANNVDANLYILKLDGEANFIWVYTLAGTTSLLAPKFDIDSLNNIYVLSDFNGSIDVVLDDNTYHFENQGDFDFLIQKLDSNGVFQTGFAIGSEGYESARSILLDKQANIYVTGTFWGDPEYNFPDTTVSLIFKGVRDIFMHKFSMDYVSIIPQYKHGLSVVYPNPTSGDFNLFSKEISSGVYQLKIINMRGQLVFENQVTVSGDLNETIQIKENGIYYLQLSNNKSVQFVQKIIVAR